VNSPVVDAVPVAVFNLSPTGVALRTKKRLPPDSSCISEFQIPGHKATIRCPGDVGLGRISRDAGVRFRQRTARHRAKALDQWLANGIDRKTREPPKWRWKVDRLAR